MRKIALPIFILALLAGCVWGYFSIKKKSDAQQTSVYNYVGNTAMAHFRFNNPHQIFDTINSEPGFFDVVCGSDKFLVPLIQQLIPDVADTNFVVRRNSVFILSSVFANAKNEVNFVHFIPIRNNVNVDDELLNIANLSEDKTSSTNKISAYKIGAAKFYLYKFDDYIAVSSSKDAILQNLQQVEADHTLGADELFSDGLRSLGRYVDANVFINAQYLPQIVDYTLNTNNAQTNEPSLSNFARWVMLDVTQAKNLCNFSGFAYVNNRNLLNIIKNRPCRQMETIGKLPSQTSFSFSENLENIDSLLYVNKQFFDDSTQNYSNRLAQISDSLYVDVVDFVKSLYPEEITLAYDANDGWLTILKVADGESLDAQMQKLDTNISFADIIEPLFGPVFGINKGKQISCFENYIVVAAKKIDKLDSGFLSNNSDYVVDKSQAALYLTPRGLSKILNLNATPKTNLFKNLFVQIVPNGRNFYVNANVIIPIQNKKRKNDALAENEQIVATDTIAEPIKKEEREVEKTVIAKSNFTFKQTINSLTSKKKFTFVQYDDNKIELLNDAGKSMFATKIDEEIEGCAGFVNPQNKGVEYLLFNTENKIYLLKTDGTSMSGFPIVLPTSATNNVMACMYDRSADYRFFIACANKRIYLYGLDGKKIEGWKIPKTNETVRRAVQFFRLGSKDYLVASDSHRVYVFNRKGEERTIVKANVQVPVGGKFEGLENPNRISVVDKSGHKIIINLINGKINKK